MHWAGWDACPLALLSEPTQRERDGLDQDPTIQQRSAETWLVSMRSMIFKLEYQQVIISHQMSMVQSRARSIQSAELSCSNMSDVNCCDVVPAKF